MFEQCKIIIFMKKHQKFSEIFRKNMKFSGQIFRLTSLVAITDHDPQYLFPDWSRFFKGIYAELNSLQRLLPMDRRNGNDHARLQ